MATATTATRRRRGSGGAVDAANEAAAGAGDGAEGHTSIFRDAMDLLLCAGSIYACYLLYGVVQERIFTNKHGPDGETFRFSAFLVFSQCVMNGLVAAAICAARPQPEARTPALEYVKISVSYIGAMFASNAALAYVSYPTQALAKSCKMIPVMLMRIVVNGKRYRAREYGHVLLITAGIATFMLMKASKKAAAASIDDETHSWAGLALLFGSLALDGFTGPNQERIRKLYAPSVHQLMLHMNVYAAGLMLAGMLAGGTFWEAATFVQRYPAVLWDLVLFSLTSALGQNFILMTLYRFNSLVLTTVTTTRKFFTILVSVLWFGHHLNAGQWGGVALVFVGLGLDTQFKYSEKKRAIAALEAASKPKSS